MIDVNESLLNINELLDSVNGIHVLGSGDFYFDSVQTDSRNVEKNTLFVPLIGEFQDGHKYIPQAIEKGASVIFVTKESYENNSLNYVDLSEKNPKVFFILVENTLTALQNAAEAYVAKFPKLIKVAVTGSSGKTTSKEIAFSVLSQKYDVVTNYGNFNSETGLPLSVFKIRKNHNLGLFEMGMNRENEIAEIAKVLKPNYVIITNIGTAHIGILKTQENIALEKSKSFTYITENGAAFVPKDDNFAEFLKSKNPGKTIYYGIDCDNSVSNIKNLGFMGSEFLLDGVKTNFTLPGEYNLKNALAVVALAKKLGLTSDEISKGLSSLKASFGRSEVIKSKYLIIQDCYNANPDSMEKAIELMALAEKESSKVLVLGDMLELGEKSKEEHLKVAELCEKACADFNILVGTEMRYAYDYLCKKGLSDKVKYFEQNDDESINQIIDFINKNVKEDSVILIKASRGIGLERVSKGLLEEANNE